MNSARPLGLLEKFSLTRNLVQSQPLPVVSFNVSIPDTTSEDELQRRIVNATAAAVSKIPSAFARCANGKSSAPTFELVAEFDAKDMVIWDDDSSSFEQSVQTVFRLDLEVETSPLPNWRLHAWRDRESSVLWISLGAGHMLFDGLATADFAKTILKHILSPAAGQHATLVKLPAQQLTLPPSLESLVSTVPSTYTLISIVFKEFVLPNLPEFIQSMFSSPKVWVGNAVRPNIPTQTVDHLAIEGVIVDKLLEVARSQGVTLHALLHGAITLALEPLIQGQDQTLSSETPLSLRRCLPNPKQTQGNYSGGVTYRCIPPYDNLWDQARAYGTWLRDDRRRSEALGEIGLLAYIPTTGDKNSSEAWETFFRRKTAAPRTTSFAINNLGRISVADAESGWIAKAAVFSERPLSTLPALLFCFATLDSAGVTGPLTLSLTRESQVVTDDEAKGIISRLKGQLLQVVQA